jgi:uncharacterized protein with beta-barrel porin domain
MKVEALGGPVGCSTRAGIAALLRKRSAKGSPGWRHAFADTPSSDYRLAGGPSFSVVGAPIASDTVVVSAGLNVDVNPGNTLVVGYQGQIGDGTEIHALEGVWSMQF